MQRCVALNRYPYPLLRGFEANCLLDVLGAPDYGLHIATPSPKDRKVVDVFVLPREDFLAGGVRTIYVQFVVGGASR